MKRLKTLLLGTAACVIIAACEAPAPDISAVQAFSDETIRDKIPTDIDLSSGKLGLRDFVRLLAVSDETVQAQDVEIAIAQQAALGAVGMFEPQAYGRFDRRYEYSQTSAADALSQSSNDTGPGQSRPFSEFTSTSRVGLEAQNPSGLKMDLFYQLGTTANSIQSNANRPTPERDAMIGASLIMPLFRNFGSNYNKAPIEIARIDEEIAKETSRLVASQRAFEAIKTYLMVQRAQSRVHLRTKAYNTASAIEAEMANQTTAGLRNASELTEARAKTSEQMALLTEARQDLNEQIGALQIFFVALPADLQANRWMPSDGLVAPAAKYVSPKRLISVDNAMEERAETRINALRIEREEVNVLIAENQALPELNLKIDAQKTHLAASYLPFRELASNGNPYHNWRLGFEFRRGILGDVTKKKDLEAARLREQQAILTMQAFRQRIASEMNGIKGILLRANEQAREQTKLVDSYWSLLQTEQKRAKVGQSSQLEVLNRELAYYIAKEGQRDAIAQQNLSSYLASHVSGTLLARMGVE